MRDPGNEVGKILQYMKSKCRQMQYSEVINFYSIIADYCCLLDPPLYCPGLNRSCFAFLLSLLNQLIMFCYKLLYRVDKCRGSERVQRDDEKQTEYICLYFCVRPLNNFGDELE